MKIHQINQGTEEWFELRKLRMTASNASAIATAGKGLETYINEMVVAFFSKAERDNYKSKDMQRGNDLEPNARVLYELETGLKVEQIGFATYNDFVGCSPDGLVGKDGLVEFKCPSDKVYIEFLQTKKVNSAYVWQMQMQMLTLNREWCDYVLYNPNFTKSFHIARLFANTEKFAKLKNGFEVGTKLIEEKIKSVGECLNDF